ncbi:hypothetical protein ACR9MO_06180 [Helicobacter pylori]|uniref:hypothetical protein n=1 Tax=Helicobacter pylori TaxID=210 RepID=UPI0013CE2EF5
MTHYPNEMCKSKAKIGQMILKMSMPIIQKAQNREKAIHRKAIDKPSGTLKD